jgi:iron(III) transport system substrate-binding protein
VPQRRHLAAALLTLALPLALAACGGGGSGEDAFEADPDALQVYSSQHRNVTEAWAQAFTEETGIKTQVREGQDASMGHMIVEEGDASPADVFLTENSPAMTIVERDGLLAPVDHETVAQVGEGMAPSSGAWTAIAARSTVLVYNTDEISEDELPTSIMDLADPEWAGRWGAAPGGADFQAIVSAMLELTGTDATQAWLEGMHENATIYANNVATMKAVNAGEVPGGVIYHYYWYRDQDGTRENSGNTKLHYFGNADPGAFVSVSGGGVLKSSARQEEAQQFLAFLAGEQGQTILGEGYSFEYPVSTGIPAKAPLPALDTLDSPVVDPSTLNGPEVIDLMMEAGLL